MYSHSGGSIMKKAWLGGLIGICCMSVANVCAQVPETLQDKVLRLEIENRELNERILSLMQELSFVRSQLTVLTGATSNGQAGAMVYPGQLSATTVYPTFAGGSVYTGQVGTTMMYPGQTGATVVYPVVALKPYYANIYIQQMCEQYPICAVWAAKRYQRKSNGKELFILTDVREETYFKEPSKMFGGSGWTYHRIYFQTSWGKEVYIERKGRGEHPLSWEEKIHDPYSFAYPVY